MKENDLAFSQKNVMNFEQIEEVPEPSYNSSMNSGVFNGINNRLNSRQSWVKGKSTMLKLIFV